jgi:hypothetical protein
MATSSESLKHAAEEKDGAALPRNDDGFVPPKKSRPDKDVAYFRLSEPTDPTDILLHALRSSIRSAGIAYAARSVLTLLLRVARGRLGKPGDALKEVFLGGEPLRFAKMFGTFTLVYKTLNGLGQKLVLGKPTRRASIVDSHLVIDPNSDPDKPRLKLRSPQFAMASLAGFMAGIAALRFESAEERLGWGQQFVVRGLQCLVVFLAKERDIYVPHGGQSIDIDPFETESDAF